MYDLERLDIEKILLSLAIYLIGRKIVMFPPYRLPIYVYPTLYFSNTILPYSVWNYSDSSFNTIIYAWNKKHD